MAINKKGIFFTFAAIALSVIIIFSFNVYNDYRLKDKVDVIEIRINTMNNFIIDLENDIENAIFIVGFRSLLSLEDYMMKYDQFFDELGAPTLSVAFNDAFLKGTINSPSGPADKMVLMDNNTFINWTTRMREQANKTDITLDFTINSVSISQSEPWRVDIKVNLEIDVQDKKNTASWTITKDYTKKINITSEGSLTKFVDPLYLVNTNGVANNTIRETPLASWPSDLSAHLTNAYYRLHSDAPSYLDRFENDLTGSTLGIESLVTLKLKSKSIIVDTGKSAVDYLYFGTSTLPCNVVDITDEDFVLDDPTHTGFYGTSCV